MFRYRRYRVFLVFALMIVFALYRFGSSGTSWREVAAKADGWRNQPQLNWNPSPQVAKETKKFEVDIPAAKSRQALETPPPIPTPINHKVPPVAPPPPKNTAEDGSKPKPSPTAAGAAVTSEVADSSNAVPPSPQDENAQVGEDRVAVTPLPASIEVIHWQKQSQFFPIPTESLIKLPSGKPKPIPKIQFAFKPESAAAKADREAKLTTIKSAFKRSWDGYRQYAWLQDELSPVSGKFRNPFAGWGATLVDSLDTLWIMGMKEEFEQAVKAVDKLDFTTTERADIPLFETTIRYLGGFIAAYDISGKVHKNLLEKAVELAEILISAFDTPNRMPQTYYFWRPEFASQKHRASNRVVLAEIGSLSMEFTRLAQLTGEQKYYDAIARITDNFEEYQNNTRLPGMWPTYLDASGCKRVYIDLPPQKPIKPVEDTIETAALTESDPSPSPTEQLSPGGKKYVPLNLPDPIVLSPNGPNPTWKPPKEDHSMLDSLGKGALQRPGPGHKKRQLDLDDPEAPEEVVSETETESSTQPRETPPECIPQGFVTSSEYGSEEYTLGGMSDSTYEYLPKEYLLLGGQIEKYRTMYEQSADTVKKHLLFRPMLPNEDDILFSGKLFVPSVSDQTKLGDLEGENAHLTCFAGGMFGMGAKIFDRPEDLEIAKKLTEGCIWSYDMTATGIMPEAFITVPCQNSKECSWNETKYHEIIDPRADSRLENYKEQLEQYKVQYASASAWYEAELAAMTAPPTSLVEAVFEAAVTETPKVYADTLDKRQLADLEDDTPEPSPAPLERENLKSTIPQGLPSRVKPLADEYESLLEQVAPPDVPLPSSSRTLPSFPVLYSPKPPLTHKEYVENRIQEERLPPGVTQIKSRSYILRPEAIESVWYMYRITGEQHWREAGWRMFEAVNTHTTAKYGNSAIDDVTKTAPELDDTMESFWLAETLKYFYLLFADESTVNLDDWVLNTEAHPFKRPS